MSRARPFALTHVLLATVPLLSPAAATHAQAPPGDRRIVVQTGGGGRPTLTVRAEGEAGAKPDLATVTVGATAQAKEAAAAQAQVGRVVRDTLARLAELGVAREQVQTSGLSLHPVYSDPSPRPLPEGVPAQPEGPREPTIVGYRATNTVSARVSDLDKVGAVIDAAVGAGANELHGVSFTLRDGADARRLALQRAAGNARAEARAVADALGLGLGPIIDVSTAPADPSPPRPYGAEVMMAARAAPTPVEPGEVRVRAGLTVTYRVVTNQEGEAPAEPRPREGEAPARRR